MLALLQALYNRHGHNHVFHGKVYDMWHLLVKVFVDGMHCKQGAVCQGTMCEQHALILELSVLLCCRRDHSTQSAGAMQLCICHYCFTVRPSLFQSVMSCCIFTSMPIWEHGSQAAKQYFAWQSEWNNILMSDDMIPKIFDHDESFLMHLSYSAHAIREPND